MHFYKASTSPFLKGTSSSTNESDNQNKDKWEISVFPEACSMSFDMKVRKRVSGTYMYVHDIAEINTGSFCYTLDSLFQQNAPTMEIQCSFSKKKT